MNCDNCFHRDPLEFLKLNVKGVGDVVKNKEAVYLLTERQKFEFEIWLIETFGVSA